MILVGRYFHSSRIRGIPALGVTWAALSCNSALLGEEPFQIRQTAWPPAVWAYRLGLREERPAVRGFRAAILGQAAAGWPFTAPSPADSPQLQKAADLVAQRLAFDGLPATASLVIEALGAPPFTAPTEASMELLRRAGLPVDLLIYFQQPGVSADSAESVVARIAHQILSGRSAVSLIDELRAWDFRFTQTAPGFRIGTDGGDDGEGLLRLQVSSDHYYLGPGDGGTLDVARQLMALHPTTDVIISLQLEHLPGFGRLAANWGLTDRRRVTLLAEPLPVAQWAQDNAKAGTIGAGDTRTPASLVPRYASRSDEGSTFVPGESFLMDSLAATGHRVIQSPLLFQGGDLIAVHDPRSRKRVLLIGEAEIYRNTALGLTREQALEAFQVEFGVDECVVLPAVSYHIDYEVTARSTPNGVTAFVNDPPAAAAIVLSIGLGPLEADGLLDAAAVRQCREHLRSGRIPACLSLVQSALARRCVRPGQYPESLANRFSAAPVDSGIGNFQRFLLAIDLLNVAGGPSMADKGPHDRAYQEAIIRNQADRRLFRERIAALGWRVLAVPSFGEPGRGINYLNGLHELGRYLMPAYGGLYAPLDQAAMHAFKQGLGEGIEIVPVLSSESQRRVGAVRCSAAVYPELRFPGIGRKPSKNAP